MGAASELLLSRLALGNIFISPCNALHRAVEIVHGGGRDPDIDQRPVLAPSLDLHIANGFAFKRPLEQFGGDGARFRGGARGGHCGQRLYRADNAERHRNGGAR